MTDDRQKRAVSIRVFGVVQGVWFRASTQRQAETLGVCGSVQNLADGSVYIEAEGSWKPIESFIEWCHRGPIHARVDQVRIEEMTFRGLSKFRIIRNV